MYVCMLCLYKLLTLTHAGPTPHFSCKMESASTDIEKVGPFASVRLWIKGILSKVAEIAKQGRKIAADDPRKLIHSFKVGLALTLVSLFYYFQPLYTNFGVSAMWAVMTVVVVFEFSVGKLLASCSMIN